MNLILLELSKGEQCYSLINKEWKLEPNMKLHKPLSAMGTGNIVIDQKLLITGGWDVGFDPSAEEYMYLLGHSSKTILRRMPEALYGHCNIHLNKSHLMVIGGANTNFDWGRETYYYNLDTNEWTRGKDLTDDRRNLACSLANINGKLVIFATGGENGEPFHGYDPLRSVEFLEVDSPDKGWKKGMVYL